MTHHGPIAFSKKGTAFISGLASGNPGIKNPASSAAYEDENSTTDWAIWGSDNLLPNKMLTDIEGCGVLASAIDGKARFGLGRGPKPFKITGYKPDGEEILEPVVNDEVSDWMEENNLFASCFGWLKDIIGFANYVVRYKFNNAGSKIGLVMRDDVTQMRYKKMDETGKIDKIILSSYWQTMLTSGDRKKISIDIPLLPEIGPATYLENIPTELRSAKEYALTGRIPGWGRNYYSLPTWYAAKKWVDIAKGVPEMKAAMFQNNIRLKYMVIVYDSYWSRVFGDEWASYAQEKKDQLRDELYSSIDNFLAGSENAYKSVFVPGNFDPISGKVFSDIEIKPIEDSTKQGELLPDSAAANSEILFALMMNPALMGADTPGGPYSGGAGSGSNIREAALVQVMIQEFERNEISRILNIVKRVNGWPKEIVWRFPSTVLTTLDSGGSTKPVTTGG